MARALRVLLIEDNDDDITLIRTAAQSAGGEHTVCSVNRASDAIELLQRGEVKDLPDLVLLDLRMRGMDGFQFLSWLRLHSRFRMPIIVLSASTLDQDIAAAYRLGARSFLNKPVVYGDLVHTMKAFFDFWSLCELPTKWTRDTAS